MSVVTALAPSARQSGTVELWILTASSENNQNMLIIVSIKPPLLETVLTPHHNVSAAFVRSWTSGGPKILQIV